MAYCTKKVSAVFILQQNDRFLFLKRTDKFNGWYLLPGGHVDEGERVLEAGVRELKEELGVVVHPQDLQFILLKPSKDYINIFFRVKKWHGIPQNIEKEKHADMAWLELSHPNIYPEVVNELKNIINGISYLEQ